MKSSSVHFTQLQRLLTDMGFSAIPQKAGWRFEHVPSGTIFLFRPYRPSDWVYEHDLFLVHSQLDGRGLMSADIFQNALEKCPA